jgi:hypothetical protein
VTCENHGTDGSATTTVVLVVEKAPRHCMMLTAERFAEGLLQRNRRMVIFRTP